MPVVILYSFFSVLALWFIGHQMVKRRFAKLKTGLADQYRQISAASTQDQPKQSLMALCVDLMRRETSDVPFEQLNPMELKLVLHANAVETLPLWMSRYAALFLPKSGRVLIGKLCDIKSSQPKQKQQHFGAIKRQQQLRSRG